MDEISEIRARINILDLVQQRVSLKKAGKNWKGLCPFHDDKNPSFFVTPTLGRYTCWSCGEKGDIFTWVMKTQNIDFGEALRQLAQQAGVTLKSKAGGTKIDRSQTEAWRAAMNDAQAFFRDQLRKSSTALDYCEKRGLDLQTLDDWEVGYAPDVGDALAQHLKRKGHNLNDCKELFLVDQDTGGGYYDRFRGRLMFPIRDEKEDLVAFGGRILGSGQPKYINSSDTPLYRKSRVLYGFHRAKNSFGKGGKAILCEGYLDVIACHRAGATGAVASLGTALSSDHAKLMKRWVDSVLILYDADAAGQKAADRAIDVLGEANLICQIALMPPGDDPDSLLQREGPGGVQRALQRSESPLDFRIHTLESTLGPEDVEFWPKLVSLLSTANSELELDRHVVLWAHQYPGHTDPVAAQRALRREVGRLKRSASADRANPGSHQTSKPTPPPRTPLLSQELVILSAFLSTDLRLAAWEILIEPTNLLTPTAREVADGIRNAFSLQPPTGEPRNWLGQLPDSVQELFAELELDNRTGPLSKEVLSDAAQRLLSKIEKRRIFERRGTAQDATEKSEIIERIAKLKGVNKQS